MHLTLVEIKGSEMSWTLDNSELASSTLRRGTEKPLGSKATFSVLFSFLFFSASLLSLVLLPQSQILRLGLSLDHGD